MSHPGQTTAGRAYAKVRRHAVRAALQARHRIAGDFLVDHGWIRLPFTGDGDWQEVLYHLNQDRWHEKDEMVFRSLVYPGATAIDVGANLGFVSAILSNLVGPTGRVIAFEPSPRIFQKLQRTIAANALDNVHPINAGCGARPSTVDLRAVGECSGNASVLGAGPVVDRIEIVRLDDVETVWRDRAALVKIDTEGFEPDVLEGARGLIAAHRPVLYLEMGGDYVESTLRSVELLDALGYDTRHIAAVDWSEYGNGADFVFLPRAGRAA